MKEVDKAVKPMTTKMHLGTMNSSLLGAMMRPDGCNDDVIIQNEQLDPESEPSYNELIKMPIRQKLRYKP